VLEPLLEVFDYGTHPFMRLPGQWRRRVIEEAAAADIDLVLTFVWGLGLEDDVREVGDYIGPYVERVAAVSFVELYADLDTRLERNRTEHRLARPTYRPRASCCLHDTSTSSSTTPGCHPMRPPRRSWLGSAADGPRRRAVIRLVGAVLTDMHDEWQAGERIAAINSGA
jgi:hypothetical protein